MPRFALPTLLLTLLTFLACSADARAQQYWDGSNTTANGVVDGGTGTWTTTTTNWTTADGTVNAKWGNGSGTGTLAVFNLAPNRTGTFNVQVGTNSTKISATGLTFNVGGYTLSSSLYSLFLTGTTSLVDVEQGADTLSVSLSSTATVIKTGQGQLILSGDNYTPSVNSSFGLTGGLVLNAGSLVAAGSGTSLGGDDTPGDPSTNPLTLNGGVGLQNYLQLSSFSSAAYNNDTTINGNVLVISDNTATESSNITVTKSFGTLNLNNGMLYNQNNAFNGTGGVTNLTFGATTLTGTTDTVISETLANTNLVTLDSVTGTNSNLVIGGTGNTTITGTVDLGSGNLVKNNLGTLTIGGTLTTTGSIIIAQEIRGSVILLGSETGTTVLVNGGALVLGSSVTGTANFLSDTGTLTLAGGNLVVSTLSGSIQQEVVGSLALGVGASRVSVLGPVSDLT